MVHWLFGQYMACMQILRVMADGDKCEVIYLPPRNASDRLPVELLDAYEGQYCQLF